MILQPAAQQRPGISIAVTMVEAGVPITEPSGEHYRKTLRSHSSPDSYLPEILPLLKFYEHDAHDAGLPGDSVTSVLGG